MLCRTAYAKPGKKSFKESILDVCKQRNDTIASQVRSRVEGAISDLHAADSRNHVNFMTAFMSPRSISAAKSSAVSPEESSDLVFEQVVSEMKIDKSRMWNTSELLEKYHLFRGSGWKRRSLLKKIKDHFLDEIAVLSSPGLASVIVFKISAVNVLNRTSEEEDDEQEIMIAKITDTIRKETKVMNRERSSYNIRISEKDMSMSISQTLLDLLLTLSDSLKKNFSCIYDWQYCYKYSI